MHYILMHKDIPVVLLTIDEATGNIIKIGALYSKEHLPVGIPVKRGKVDSYDLKFWWNERSIPIGRDGIELVLESLQIKHTRSLLPKSLGLSLSDQYWIRPVGQEDLTWEQVNLFENAFCFSPDYTCDGYLKKRWTIIDGKRCLFKAGSHPYRQQPFNEAIATIIAKALHIDCVPYWTIWEDENVYSVCENFITKDTELVTAWRVMQTQKKSNNVSVYRHYIACCETFGICDMTQKLDEMLVLDYIIANEDRHQNNFGLIRNANTLEWIGVAPIYDSGTSLGYDKTAKQMAIEKNIECKPFKTSHEKQIELVSAFDWIDFQALEQVEEKIREVFGSEVEKERVDAIIQGIKKRIERLKKLALRKLCVVDDVREDVVKDQAEQYGEK